MKKYDVTTSHCYTQHWEVTAKDKTEAAKKVMEGDMKFDKPSRTYVSNKLTRTLITIPDAKILAVEPVVSEAPEDNWDSISYGGTDPN
tara:strand:- start:7717 stop:7980 length:264 start_codon:yes stop_codon:yes gene_type:complete